MRLLSRHRADLELTPWWIGCSGPERRYWLEVPQLTEYQDDLSVSRWTGWGTLHSVWVCRVKCRRKTTDTADLKTTEEALAEDTTAFEDITQDCLACQTKFVEFKAHNKSLSEGLEALAKAKAVIYEKTGDAEYRDNRLVLPSRGSLVGEPKGEHSIELLASRVDPAMHAETSNDDDLCAKVKGLIGDMIARLEEKASADATHNATSNVYTVVHSTDGLKNHRQASSGCLTIVFILRRDVLP